MPRNNIFRRILEGVNVVEKHPPEPLNDREIFAPRERQPDELRRQQEDEFILAQVHRRIRQGLMNGRNGRPNRAIMMQKSKREKDI